MSLKRGRHVFYAFGEGGGQSFASKFKFCTIYASVKVAPGKGGAGTWQKSVCPYRGPIMTSLSNIILTLEIIEI